jgi:hypothetical protein
MSNYSKIVLKNSDVTGALPVTDFLDFGEIALNYRDEKIYFKNADGNITLFETPDISINGVASTVVRRDSTGKGLFVGLSTTVSSAQPSILAINEGAGSGALIQSNTGTYHAEFGNIGSDNAAAIDRVRGSYTFFYNGYKGKIKSSNITADRDWTLPNASGTVALTTDITTAVNSLDASQISSGIIDPARLPSYVDDVLEYANFAAFPTIGEAHKIYVALDTNKIYRWSGSAYIQINADQTITLTSDVTGSGTGSFATTIATGAVSLAKMANVASSTIFYRKTAGTGAPEVQTLATLKTDLGLSNTNSGDQTITLTGAVTGFGTGTFVTTLADDVVSLAKMANVATSTIFYRKTAGTGDPEVQTLATLKTDLNLVEKLASSEYTVTNPTSVKTFNATTATIDNVCDVLATLIKTLKDRQII